jgi:hypothetical protein
MKKYIAFIIIIEILSLLLCGVINLMCYLSGMPFGIALYWQIPLCVFLLSLISIGLDYITK